MRKKYGKKVKSKAFAIALIILVINLLLSGCSGEQETVKDETSKNNLRKSFVRPEPCLKDDPQLFSTLWNSSKSFVEPTYLPFQANYASYELECGVGDDGTTYSLHYLSLDSQDISIRVMPFTSVRSDAEFYKTVNNIDYYTVGSAIYFFYNNTVYAVRGLEKGVQMEYDVILKVAQSLKAREKSAISMDFKDIAIPTFANARILNSTTFITNDSKFVNHIMYKLIDSPWRDLDIEWSNKAYKRPFIPGQDEVINEDGKEYQFIALKENSYSLQFQENGLLISTEVNDLIKDKKISREEAKAILLGYAKSLRH